MKAGVRLSVALQSVLQFRSRTSDVALYTAMAGGATDRLWSVEEFIEAAQ